MKRAQAALESSEKEFDELVDEKEAYADAMAQEQYEALLAAGYSYEQALAEGQAALNMAEADYDAMLADQQAYADAVAQQQFEQALAMGFPYDRAVQEGQYALEEAERQYSQSMMENMQDPQIDLEQEAYAEQVGQEQYDLAKWMGMTESQAQAQGEYSYVVVHQVVMDEATAQQMAFQKGYKRFMEGAAKRQEMKQRRMMKRMQEKMRRETKALTNYAKAHE